MFSGFHIIPFTTAPERDIPFTTAPERDIPFTTAPDRDIHFTTAPERDIHLQPLPKGIHPLQHIYIHNKFPAGIHMLSL